MTAKRIRYIRKVGNSYYIKLEPADIKDYGFKDKDKVDISDINKLKKKSK
ncbi:MAG: hypothetical protein ACOC56_06090 [Atribacterota bacterium]